METTKTAIVLFVVLCALLGGITIGYFVWGATSSDLLSELATLENRLVVAQGRIEELSAANRDLAERQQRAQSIVARTAGNLAAAGATADRIDELIDRIIETVDELERAYRALDGE